MAHEIKTSIGDSDWVEIEVEDTKGVPIKDDTYFMSFSPDRDEVSTAFIPATATVVTDSKVIVRLKVGGDGYTGLLPGSYWASARTVGPSITRTITARNDRVDIR